MKNLRGTKTERNLMAAFTGEALAYLKYLCFAEAAEVQGQQRNAPLFREIAVHERENAKKWLEMLGGIGSTAENFKVAAASEKYEWQQLYPDFAKTARDEGFAEIAEKFEAVAQMAKRHEEDFLESLKDLEPSSGKGGKGRGEMH
ncbi:MAG: rubrerythrin family protein [Calditrichaeota bacterium]|nr:rubrerythrin family protein [Calditrichota bacterium]